MKPVFALALVLGFCSLALSLEASAKRVGCPGGIVKHSAYHCEDAERLARSKVVTLETKCRATILMSGAVLRNLRSVVKGCQNEQGRVLCGSTCQVDVIGETN